MALPEAYPRDEEEMCACLFGALMELMQTTPLDRLSVSTITDTAHVSRASFYRRYRDKYDLLNQSYERILENTLFTVNSGVSWREAVTRIYRVIGENARFFANAFSSAGQNSLRQYICERSLRLEKELLRHQGVDPESDAVRYRLAAYVAAGMEVTVTWVRDGAVLPLEEFIDLLMETIPDGLRAYFV